MCVCVPAVVLPALFPGENRIALPTCRVMTAMLIIEALFGHMLARGSLQGCDASMELFVLLGVLTPSLHRPLHSTRCSNPKQRKRRSNKKRESLCHKNSERARERERERVAILAQAVSAQGAAP